MPRHRELESLGRRIRELRGKQTQKAFGERYRVNQDMLSRYELGRTPPPLHFLIDLCSDHQKSLDWLVFGDQAKVLDREPGLEEANERLKQVWASGDARKKALLWWMLAELSR